MPWIVKDLCPEEGCEFGPWIACDTMTVRIAEDRDAPPAFQLAKNERFHALTGNVHVERPGIITFTDTVRIQRDEPQLPPAVYTPADTLYPLYYGSEGTGAWFFHGRLGGGEWFFPHSRNGWGGTAGVVLSQELVESWWVRVRDLHGRAGWILVAHGARIAGSSPHYEDNPPSCSEFRPDSSRTTGR